jgi:hypothetical protein
MNEEKLGRVYERFGLSQGDIDYLRAWPIGKVRYGAVYSAVEAAYLAAGASLEARKLVAIKASWGDRVVAWPLWSVSRNKAFVLAFRWDKEWRPTGWLAENTEFFASQFCRGRFAQDEKPWVWAGFASLALDHSWLEHGVSLLNGRFRTSFAFVADFGKQPQSGLLPEEAED